METEAFSEHEAREARENRLRRRNERDRARRRACLSYDVSESSRSLLVCSRASLASAE